MATITKVGKKWRAQVRKIGMKSIAKTHPSKAAAERWAYEIEYGEGSNANVLIENLIDDYRKARAESGSPVVKKGNEDYMLMHLSDDLGKIAAMNLGTPQLLLWAQRRTKQGSGPVALNMELSKLGTILRFTASLRNLRLPDIVSQARPTLQHYRLIGNAKKRTRIPTPDELARICRWFREHPEHDIPMIDIIKVLRQAILRRGEIFRIEWTDLREQGRGVWVRDRKHPRWKTGNHEFILLTGDSWEIIQRQPRRDARIFPYLPGTVSKYFKWACDANGIADLHLHDLKRDATTALAEIGLTPQEVAAAGGPKKWEVQAIYTDLDRVRLSEKIVRLKTGS